MVGEQYRLRPLQVGVAGEHEIPVSLSYLHERPQRREHTVLYSLRRVADEEVEVERHLVVAAAARVQLEGYVAYQFSEPPLDRCMDVLVLNGPGELSRLDLRQHPL